MAYVKMEKMIENGFYRESEYEMEGGKVRDKCVVKRYEEKGRREQYPMKCKRRFCFPYPFRECSF